MNPSPRQPALFVSHASSLSSAPGGVQRCTREYLHALTSAGYDLTELSYVEDRRAIARLRRRFFPRPYRNKLPPHFADHCLAEAHRIGARWIFLNHGDTAPLAEELARRAPGRHGFALLSHGLDSTDELHETRIRGLDASPAKAAWLGAQLFAEMRQRQALDAVFCLSETDLQMERWLGAARVCLVPRIVAKTPLALAPIAGRIGTVSTLNHPPNAEGLELLAHALAPHPGVRLRLVGGPSPAGERLARKFRCIDYLGPLDDTSLEREAASWACFVNPIFCYPRGASTKLAVPLSWGLPIATTRAGARGYRWNENLVPLADTPQDLATHAAALATLEHHAATRTAIATLAASSPSLEEVASLMRETLAAAEAAGSSGYSRVGQQR